ncbi:MAG TPA: polyprenyl synthetase family protein [Roseiflexaceae bacterium]|nr:polyprenyl synthetase family protein [Roseiflexaceae bacterium]
MNQLPIPPELLDDLHIVDQIVVERVQPRLAVIKVAGQHILTSGGKRIRAALALLTAQLGRYDLDRVVHSAAAVELIHAASLVHDDLVDEAERRRGTVTVHTRWDGNVALMVGDYLFALAAAEMALAPDPRIIEYFSRGVMTICEGELSPVMDVAPLELATEQYLYKIGCKTAALFEAACKAGMVCGGGAQDRVDAIGRFGYDLGLAFQIVDDVLDYTADDATLGKPAGNDLREGTITLPLIYAVDAGAGHALAGLLDARPIDEVRIAAAIGEVRRVGTTRAMQDARRYAESALLHLDSFPDSPAKHALSQIAQFVVTREV